MRNHILAACALALAVSGASAAQAVSYTTDTASYTGLGDSIGSPFDQVTFNSVTGSAFGSGTFLVNTVDFTVGINANSGGNFTGSFTNTAIVGGISMSYVVPYALTIGSSDSITIGGNDIFVNGAHVHFNALTFSNNGGGTVSGDLTATVSVPEAASWAMMVAGFGLVGATMRSRRTVIRFA